MLELRWVHSSQCEWKDNGEVLDLNKYPGRLSILKMSKKIMIETKREKKLIILILIKKKKNLITNA